MIASLKNIGIAVVAVAFALLLVGSLGIATYNAKANSVGGNYYKSLSSSNASSTAPTTIRTTEGVFGGLVIGSSTPAGVIRIYDSNNGTSSPQSVLIAQIRAGASEGTYTFDVAVQRGIQLDIPSTYAGNMTVISRD